MFAQPLPYFSWERIMKFSEAWLREFVDPPITTEELVHQLTMAGLEVDGCAPVASKFSKVIIGEIVQTDRHPDAEKLLVCKVNSGSEELQVVCGAPNARTGIKVPFALVGAKLGKEKIKKAKLRGVDSFGMLCSERELGISDFHEGLMEFPFDAPVGEDVRHFLNLDDNVFDLDLTPNRSDCLGIVGLARETGLINKIDVSYPEDRCIAPVVEDIFPVELGHPETCPRFVSRVLRNININALTPLRIKEKLRRSGIRSIDPVVDVTNYVMLELNQPMHAYDLNQLKEKIVVRQSNEGERITLLNGQDVILTEETLLITDGNGPVGIGGVMGGLTTSVTSSTKDILLESAWFAPSAIAGRARSYGLSSDAAHRFERGVDWQGQISAMERATELLIAIVGGEAGPLNDCVQTQYLPEMEEVKLRASRVEKLLGVAIDASTIEGILERLGFEFRCSEAGNNTYWIVKAPSHRFDISIEADLIEEISRVYGYNSLPVRTPITSLKMRSNDESEIPLGRIRSQLVARGYQETINYSFVDPEIETLLDPEKDPLKLANPLSLDMSVMRTTLWTGLLKSLIYNLNRQHDRVRLFEVGLRFEQAKGISEIGFTNILQEKTVGGVACGSRRAENWANDRNMIDFYDVKGDLESILALTSAKFELMPVSRPGLQAGQAAEIRRDEELVGYLGLLDPRVQKALVIRSPVYLFELKVEAITNKVVPKVELLSKFPEVRRDVAIIVDQSVTAENLITCIYSVNDESLVNLKLFDVYQGKGIDTNRKSIAMGLTFRHGSRTLNDEEINQSISKIVSSLKSKLGASLRD